MEYIDKLIECFETAEIQDDGLIHMTPELRDQIVSELRKLKLEDLPIPPYK